MDEILQGEIGRLRAAGVSLDSLGAGELASLVRACDRMADPFGAVNAEAAGFPVRVSEGVSLWRPTIGSQVWLDEYAARWWPVGSAAFRLASVYALRHAREREAFAGLTDEAAAYRAVRADLLSLDCTEDEIAAAMARFHEDEDRAGPGSALRSPDWRAVVQSLEGRTGLPADVWTWLRSSREALGVYRRLNDFAAAMGGSRPPRMRDELDRATTALARVVAGILAARGKGGA